METATAPNASDTNLPVKYSPDDAKIAEFKERYTGLKADTPDGYKQVAAALAVLRGARTTAAEAKPDIEKIHALADYLRNLELPTVKNAEAKEFVTAVRNDLEEIAVNCTNFTVTKKGNKPAPEGGKP